MGSDLTYVVAKMMRGGWQLPDASYTEQLLFDDGSNGDPSAKDGIFTSNRLALASHWKVAPGPLVLRYAAANKAGHLLSVDTESLEARKP